MICQATRQERRRDSREGSPRSLPPSTALGGSVRHNHRLRSRRLKPTTHRLAERAGQSERKGKGAIWPLYQQGAGQQGYRKVRNVVGQLLGTAGHGCLDQGEAAIRRVGMLDAT